MAAYVCAVAIAMYNIIYITYNVQFILPYTLCVLYYILHIICYILSVVYIWYVILRHALYTMCNVIFYYLHNIPCTALCIRRQGHPRWRRHSYQCGGPQRQVDPLRRGAPRRRGDFWNISLTRISSLPMSTRTSSVTGPSSAVRTFSVTRRPFSPRSILRPLSDKDILSNEDILGNKEILGDEDILGDG